MLRLSHLAAADTRRETTQLLLLSGLGVRA